ncbi:MAG: alpha-amylase family glycosyl hydrolase [Bacteroidales bacterium]|nr:alpha-amylase family glycosyl hydrolase [Bacteroidales bacterium]
MGKTLIYQLLLRHWNKASQRIPATGRFPDIDDGALEYFRGLGVTHLWLTGVIRHATTVPYPSCPASDPSVVKGAAGSPYAIVDYYDVNPYLAENVEERMAEFEQLLRRAEDHGIKVLIDFVPNHVSRDYGKAGLVRKDVVPLGGEDDVTVHWKSGNDFYYYPGESLRLPLKDGSQTYSEYPAKASGNCFSPSPGVNDWYETVRINYCDFHTSTWDKMYDIVRYWCGKGVGGFRCDMVEMVPWQFFKWLTGKIKAEFPDVVFIAEVYSVDLYRRYLEEAGFDLLYDKSGFYDTIRELVEGRGSARKLTRCWQFLGDLQPGMLNFLENHDEQRFASDFFGRDARRTFAALGASLLFNTSSFMVYSGEEIGERGMDAEGFSGLDGRTSIFDWCSPASEGSLIEYSHSGKGLDEVQESLLARWKEMLALSGRKAFAEGLTYDLGWCNESSAGFDPDRHFAFLRGQKGPSEDLYLVFCNFSSETATAEIRIPEHALRFFGKEKTETLLRSISVNPDDCLVVRI